MDDEELNREIIQEYLEDEDCELIEAESGEQALALLETGDFDAVLLDRMMPGLDGTEVLQRMKQDSRLADLPVIFQTAAAAHEQVAEGLRMGAYYYLTKPYHRDALVAVVEAALQIGRERRELAHQLSEYSGVMHLVEEARYRFRTLQEARALAAALAAACEEPQRAGLGLVEVLINAVEHGNLGIEFEEKAQLLNSGRWQSEVDARLARPENLNKFVQVHAHRDGTELVIHIKDQGNGFDWKQFLAMDEKRAFYPNGRGITLAREIAFNALQYRGCGNEVEVRVTAARVLGAKARPAAVVARAKGA
ncbi:MAG TPA: response regulator [Burkholderiales bacterium]|nr:response regulator [Burkholderiales bacterium]